MDVLIAPDVYVNASVALGSPPEKVVQRIFGKPGARGAATGWMIDRVRAMLQAAPDFKADAVEDQITRIKSLVDPLEDSASYDAGQWEEALAAAAKLAGTRRVITDHPDLLALESSTVEFISTEAWLIEQSIPPPPPGS